MVMKQIPSKEILVSSLISEYRHHYYGLEKDKVIKVLKGEEDISIFEVKLSTYSDILAPDRLRAMKNSLISFTTILCRYAIEIGLDMEKSFSTSDYFINEIELKKSKDELQTLMEKLISTYIYLVRNSINTYSLHVSRSIRYIHSQLYEPITVKEVATHVNINPKYLSKVFTDEVGISTSQYIIEKKMEEAKELLIQTSYTVKEISDMLGYCSPNYFSTEFKKRVGVSPKKYALNPFYT